MAMVLSVRAPRKGGGKASQVVFSPHCFTWNPYLNSDPLPQASPLGWQATDITEACRGWVMRQCPPATHRVGKLTVLVVALSVTLSLIPKRAGLSSLAWSGWEVRPTEGA